MKYRPLIAATLVLLTIPLPASAEGPRRGPPGEADHARMEKREADDIALVLALRPDQRPKLAAFLQSMRPPAPPAGEDRGPPDPRADPRADPPQDGFARHLARIEKDAASDAAADRDRIAAVHGFYDGLDATQRAAFEALMRLRMGPGGPGPHGPPPEEDRDGPPPRR